MRVRAVDPTDVNWTSEAPAYRVYFWRRPTVEVLPEGITEEQVMVTSYEYELTECHNVREALAWADENAGANRTYTLYAVADVGYAGPDGDARYEKGLIRLFGIDLTRNPGDRKPSWPGEIYMPPE